MPVKGLPANLIVKHTHHCTSAIPDMAKSSPNMLHISVQSQNKKKKKKKNKLGF